MDELIKQLEARRAALIKDMEAAVKPSADEHRSATPPELARFAEAKGALAQVDAQLAEFRAQAERERNAQQARSLAGAGTEGRASLSVTAEPQVYGRGSGHSYFLDQARATLNRGDGDGGPQAARARQERHEAELRVEMPKRIEKRNAQAAAAMERVLSGEDWNPRDRREARMAARERRAYERFLSEGMQVFETRAIGTVDGSGGYFVPPLWLVDEYVEYLRAGREFVNLWRNIPLPAGTNSINIPRLVVGSGTGPQSAEGAPLPSRDMQDSFVNALVRTVAGQQDVALQLLDQSPIAFDQVIFPDLIADYNMQVDGQALIGSGTGGQLTGLFSTGVIGSSTGASAYGYVVNDTAAAWTAASGANFYTGAAKLLSNVTRNRLRPPSHIVTHPAAWYALAGSADANGRPLVVPAQQGMGFNQAAGDNGAPRAEGPVGHILGRLWVADLNVPLTFGGTTAPAVGTVSNGHTAPIPGSGTGADYTPLIAGVMDDLFIWESELRTRTLSEVLSGTLQVRFQVYGFAATMPNRYQDSSGNPVSYGNYNNVGTTGGVLSTAGLLSGF